MGKYRMENIKSIGKAQVTLSLNLRQRGEVKDKTIVLKKETMVPNPLLSGK